MKHDTHVIGPGWTLDINWQDSSKSGQSKDFEEGKWCSSHARATATCEQSRPKQEWKDQASDTHKWLRALFGWFVWRGVNIDDVTIHYSQGSRINPTLRVCKHDRVAHASNITVFCQHLRRPIILAILALARYIVMNNISVYLYP